MLDPNVVISGVLSSQGAPAEVLRALAAGEFELIVSQDCSTSSGGTAYPKLRRHIDEAAAAELVRWLADSATHAG